MMAAQALYLKWRPQRFEDVVGQEHVTRTLRNALRAGRISHAYLFTGPRGTGKTTMARLLAKAVNCLDDDVANRPCNKCAMCLAINEGRLLDLIEMDAASHTGVDNVREAIRDKVSFHPTEARYKVYVIDEVHMLSTSAFNALLKTLEEPPEHVVFCLATTEPHKVLPTILSRCQRFDFHRIAHSALVARLEHIADQEGIGIESDALHLIARTATGCARDAISLLDQIAAYDDEVITVGRVQSVLGLGDAELVRQLVVHMIEHEVGRGLEIIEQAIEQGVDIRQFTQQIVEDLRSLLLSRVGGKDMASAPRMELRSGLESLVDRVSVRDLVQAIKLFNQAQLDLRGSDQNRIALELAFVEAAMDDEAAREDMPGFPQSVSTATSEAPKAAEQPSSSTRSVPAAPPRSAPGATGVRPREPEAVVQEGPEPEYQGTSVSLEEVQGNWQEILQTIKAESPGVATFVNSASVRSVIGPNQVVLEFVGAKSDPSYNFSATKLEDEANKRIVERALRAVLGKPCRILCEVRDASSPQSTGQPGSVGPAGKRPMGENAGQASEPQVLEESEVPTVHRSDERSSGRPVPDTYEQAISDPVVQDLIDRGGQVTDVQVLSEE
jgi:DNA polymerase-3 subunit gamma/tau